MVRHALMLLVVLFGGYLFVSSMLARPLFKVVTTFPSPGQLKVITAEIPMDGEYQLEISMPMAPTDRGFEPDSIDCPISVRIESSGNSPQETNFTQIRRSAEIPSQQRYLYEFDFDRPWHLRRGPAKLALQTGSSCNDSRLRDASVSFTEFDRGLEGSVALLQLKFLAGVALVVFGILGSVRLERKYRRSRS